ncbi:hypothetical protein EDC64_1471, partial [Aquabacter spiritensis]
ADSGYFSQANVEACAETEITPLIAPGRERHNLNRLEKGEIIGRAVLVP